MLHYRAPTPLPPFRRARDIIAGSGRLLRPKASMTVSEWAARYMGHDFGAAPWQAEIMDALGDPETAEVGLQGPAQQGKSEIGLAWVGYCIAQDPGDFILCQPDKGMADDFVKRRVAPFIGKTPALREELLPAANADNVFLKQFRGMLLSTIWPVGAQFRARPCPNGWLDDYDQFPDDIDGQGDAVALLDGRQTTFEGRDKKFVSSSPAREDGSGIEAFVAQSSDERLLPVCPHCEERFEPQTLRDLKFDGSTPDHAALSAYVKCPNNGCILVPDDKFALLSSLNDLPNRGWVAQNPEAGKRRRGFTVDGLLGFRSWGEIARKWREAQIAWETRQDESKLRAFANVVAGCNYRSILSGEKPLDSDDLAQLKESTWRLGTVPKGPVVITIAVDTQFDRFECEAVAWADGMESWIVDRWSIDVLEDGLTQPDPFKKPEHWRVLLPLFDKTWPLAGVEGRSPKPLAVAIDTGGGGDKEANATDGAYKFWHIARAAGVHPSRIMLVKGSSKVTSDLVGRARRADQKIKGGVKRNSPTLWLVNVHKGKHIIDARLRRHDDGPGRIHLPRDWRDEWSAELTAEQLEKGRWKKVRARNETLDLSLYAWFALLKPPFAQSRASMRWVPADFRIAWPAGAHVVPIDQDEPDRAAVAMEVPPPPPVRAKRGPQRLRTPRKAGWMGRL